MDTVRMWMSSPAISAPQTLTLPEARELMRQYHIRRLPVVDESGDLVGIVTEGDIAKISDSPVTDVRDYNLYYRIRNLPIHEIMTRHVISVAVDTPIISVAQLLLEHRIGGVPVVDQNRLVGVITESDLFRLIVQRQSQEAWRSVHG
ncbi:MAG: CBS domain-containing protein [Roseiflexaceae bacterium]